MVILFNFYDDGEEYSINSATKAIVHQKTSKGNIIETPCTFTNHNGKRVVRFEVEDVAMVEFGYLTLLLTVWNGDEVVSIQPFNVMVYDDYMGGASSFIELIQELQRLIENMVGDLNNTVKLTDKGIPNGVASLDELGKIPLVQMPQEFQGFLDHINHTVFEHRVHGLGLDEDEQLMYQDNNGDWQYIGFSPTGVGGGATQTVSASISVANSVATVIYSGVPAVVQSKWSTGDKVISHFALNGNSFTGNTFPVSSIGIHTLYYKDSNGLEYVKTFNVAMDMIARPNVSINVEDGYVTINIPPNVSTSIKKWAKGNQSIPYFAYNGTVFTGITFQVSEVGTYTVYIKTSGGLEYVYTFDVTEAMLPVISKPKMEIIQSVYHLDTLNTFMFIMNVRDDVYKITKVKNVKDSDYVNLTNPLAAGQTHNFNDYNQILNFDLSSNRNKEITVGFENEIGSRCEYVIYADSNYIYYWDKDSNEVTLANIQKGSSAWNASTLSLPSAIKGKSIIQLGEKSNNTILGNDKVTNLTIPSTVKYVYTIFINSNALSTVTILNDNLEYKPRPSYNWYAFRNSANIITMRSSNNSTTKSFVQERQGESGYKLAFQAT